MNTFLTKSCPPSGGTGPGGKDTDYSEAKCQNICGMRDKKTGNAIYPEGLSVTNIVFANDPDHLELSPTVSNEEYNARTKSQTSFTCPDLMSKGYCKKYEPIGAGTALIKIENRTFIGWTGKHEGVSRDGYYENAYETHLYVDAVGKGDVIQSYPVITEEASGKPPASTVKCSPPNNTQTAPQCKENHDAFEDFIYNVPKDMDLLGVTTDWASLGITNDWWLGTERCATGVGPNDRRMLHSHELVTVKDSNDGILSPENKMVEHIGRGLSGGPPPPSQQSINSCIMRERRLFMQSHLRMSKLKVDVSYSQSAFRQHKVYQNIPILLGSMQGLLMTIFAGLATLLRLTPCMVKQQKKSEALHKELQLAYVGGAHTETGNNTTIVSKYVAPSDASDNNIKQKLRSLERQIQQIYNDIGAEK
eukprot:g4103.t1